MNDLDKTHILRVLRTYLTRKILITRKHLHIARHQICQDPDLQISQTNVGTWKNVADVKRGPRTIGQHVGDGNLGILCIETLGRYILRLKSRFRSAGRERRGHLTKLRDGLHLGSAIHKCDQWCIGGGLKLSRGLLASPDGILVVGRLQVGSRSLWFVCEPYPSRGSLISLGTDYANGQECQERSISPF